MGYGAKWPGKGGASSGAMGSVVTGAPVGSVGTGGAVNSAAAAGNPNPGSDQSRVVSFLRC